MLFSIYINDLFMLVSDSLICNDADDIAIYACDYQNEEIIRKSGKFGVEQRKTFWCKTEHVDNILYLSIYLYAYFVVLT